jgi:hypothetical protein
MIKRLLTVVIALSLAACATHSRRDALPVSDLLTLEANVKRETRPVLLPNGKEYCAELARTGDEMDECTGDLEDALYRANRNLERAWRTVAAFVTGERARRNPCAWWNLRCRAQR